MATFITHCLQCGKSYQAERKNSKYCSDKCRVTANRQHKNNVYVDVEISTATAALDRLLNADDGDLLKYAQYFDMIFKRSDQLKRNLEEAGDRRFYGHSKHDIWCKGCGQKRLTAPVPGDKCSFCGNEDWLGKQ